MNIFKLSILGITLFILGSTHVNAQVGISINLNMQPQWGPVEYDYVDYYYMPEYGIYYNAPQRQFIYQKGTRWITVSTLPYQYRHIDLYNTYKVVINEPQPYLRNEYYAAHYKEYKGQHSKQSLIRDSKDSRYEKHNEHPSNSGGNQGGRVQQRTMDSHVNRGGNGGEHQQGHEKQGHQGKGNKNH